ncbi:PTS mannitol transporter subunit IICBA [Bacillus sp. NTK071]|uniref:PTS system mannitol-specific EIICB component n=1 Tax=Guptibacillus hwajinpoensis TaxID=208199 RepID=A0A4U1MB87_9BACL|nr:MULTISPECIES: PTS mannitol transporter subunit IICBA [Bacillaceae]MBN8211013.1 PTS mannitol transporter subunit IICBA [Bacillus sp. NTK071]TKD67494.1 PTS mannitol transporter subunit IICBA [Pseudalkalibacillus hwajinpoensis]
MSEQNSTEKSGLKVKVQRFGSYLSSMIMPNIGAFIAWGIITALFIPTGWTPNENLAELVGPMITYLLPLLIGYTGGKIIHGGRGGVVGATATMGVIVGADIPMFLGAMVMGPLGGYAIKKFDQAIHGKIKSGFEMLVNNFSAGIIGGLLTILASIGIGPVVLGLNKALAAGVQVIVDAGLLPLASILIEPAKVLFLNNAINHGILSPLGIEQAANTGKSILFLLESNPGPGLGILLAYWFVGRGTAKQTAPGAAIIHFFGGIHEIYFPYILMKPALLLAVILGGMSGVFTLTIFGAGLIAPPSPGSIFALMIMTPRGGYLGVLAGVVVATVVSFLVASFILKRSKDSGEDISEATEKMEAMKGKKSSVSSNLRTNSEEPKEAEAPSYSNIAKVVFACDAGMGSSAMGASVLRNKFKKAGLTDIEVINTSISNLPEDADLVITHQDLTDRAKVKLPKTNHISVKNFMNSPKYDELVAELSSAGKAPVEVEPEQVENKEINKVVFACDAGMGSSAMGASVLRNKFKKAGLQDIEVTNTAISNLPDDADLIVTHQDLTDRAKAKRPNTEHISVANFMNSPKYEELVERLKK